jgi:hypothetical protein
MARDYESIVKALLTKANAVGVTQAEKEQLENKAFELMDRYKIKATLDERNTDAKASHFPVTFTGQWVTRQVSLFNTISNHFSCTLIDATNSSRLGNTYYIFGYESDVDATLFLYTIVENQMLAELAKVRVPAGTNTKSHRNAWLQGYTYRIGERLREAKRVTESETEPGYALVLRDRSLAVREEISNIIGKTRTTQSTYRGAGAFNQGQEAGSRASFSLNQNIKNPRGREIS